MFVRLNTSIKPTFILNGLTNVLWSVSIVSRTSGLELCDLEDSLTSPVQTLVMKWNFSLEHFYNRVSRRGWNLFWEAMIMMMNDGSVFQRKLNTTHTGTGSWQKI